LMWVRLNLNWVFKAEPSKQLQDVFQDKLGPYSQPISYL
jgi:hypothetical protein